MVSVLLNWSYILITAFLMGFGLRALVDRLFQYKIKEAGSIIAMGLMAVTVYAQIFSLFYKVGLVANLILVLICLIIAVKERQAIAEVTGTAWQGRGTIWKLLMAVSVIVWSYCTSRGYMHYDSDLYHAQSIRWIEEYGIVKGLGNIHVRFAYNSSFFALSALYSMKFLCGVSLHAVNGFIAVLLWTEIMKLFQNHKNKKTMVTDFARLGALYYLTIVYSGIVAPASDYAIMCVVFLIIIKWLELLENDVHDIPPYALLCVAGVYAVTLKLTAGLILILLIKPASMLIREKKWKDIGIYILMGVVTLFPWMARTVIISGYLLYPFPALDIFNVDWKIDAAAAALDAAEIKTWGRGLENAALVDLPVSEWIASWFQNTLPGIGKLLIVADVLCLFVMVVLMIRFLRKKDQDPLYSGQLLVLSTVAISYLFWQLSAPLLRYGYAYVLLVVMITAGIVYDLFAKMMEKEQKIQILKAMRALGVALLVLFCAAKTVSLARYVQDESGKDAYVWQQDYGRYELESYEVNGITFYYPVSGDRTGYDSFPSLPRQTQICFRGQGIADGFRDF